MIFRTLLASTALAALTLSAPAMAQQDVVPAIAQGNTLLTVQGQGSANSEPDVAVFSAGVSTQAETAAAALAENSRKMQGVIDSLKRSGIADRDIQTSNLSINPVYVDPERDAMMAARPTGQPYSPPPPNAERLRRIVGYEVSNNVMVRQRDLKEFGKVIDTLVAAGANQVNGPNFQLEDQDAAQDQARTAAMKDARKNAELLARAAGLRIVRVVSISEGGGYYRPQPVFRTTAAMNAPPPPPPAPMQPGEVEINSGVTVLYELAP